MDDLISRQTLLNKFEPWLKVKDYNDGELNMLKAVLYEIRFMPSATDINVGTKLGTDCISRQEAIDIVDGWFKRIGLNGDICVDGLRQLPSVQPEPIRINLNEPIKVKLTDWGKEIYYHQYDRANQIAGREICKPEFPKEDENGYTEFQLWCFMELYGEHMGMTLPNVIEPLEIVYER